MKKYTLELSDDEMCYLAEMSALTLTLLSSVKSELQSKKTDKMQRLCAKLMEEAHNVPSIADNLEWNGELKQWFFTPTHIQRSYFTELLNEAQDAIFWSELVGRMAEHTLVHALPEKELKKMSDEERMARTSSLENALWHEVTTHGLDRLIFMLPEEDA